MPAQKQIQGRQRTLTPGIKKAAHTIRRTHRDVQVPLARQNAFREELRAEKLGGLSANTSRIAHAKYDTAQANAHARLLACAAEKERTAEEVVRCFLQHHQPTDGFFLLDMSEDFMSRVVAPVGALENVLTAALQDDVVSFQTHAQLRKLSPREDWEQCQWSERAGSAMMQNVKQKALKSYESVKVVGPVVSFGTEQRVAKATRK